MKHEYFVLKRPKSGDSDAVTDFVDVEPRVVGDAPHCPACGQALGSLRWLPPHHVEIETWGSEFGDVVFGPGPDLLVSERFAFLWEQEGLSGLEGFDPVKVERAVCRSRGIPEAPSYFRVDVEQSDVAVDELSSGLERDGEPSCDECRIGGIVKRSRRIVLESGSHESRDLFVARGLPGVVLASWRFERFCVGHGIGNAVLVPADSYSFDFYAGGGGELGAFR